MRRLSQVRYVLAATCLAAIAWIAMAQQPGHVTDVSLKNAARNGEVGATPLMANGVLYGSLGCKPVWRVKVTEK